MYSGIRSHYIIHSFWDIFFFFLVGHFLWRELNLQNRTKRSHISSLKYLPRQQCLHNGLKDQAGTKFKSLIVASSGYISFTFVANLIYILALPPHLDIVIITIIIALFSIIIIIIIFLYSSVICSFTCPLKWCRQS